MLIEIVHLRSKIETRVIKNCPSVWKAVSLLLCELIGDNDDVCRWWQYFQYKTEVTKSRKNVSRQNYAIVFRTTSA